MTEHTPEHKSPIEPNQEPLQDPLKKAVALSYDGIKAPTVSATGEGLTAEEIIAIARDHGVPLYENNDLTNLLTNLQLGDEIPKALYLIIAELIAFSYHIRGKTPSKN